MPICIDPCWYECRPVVPGWRGFPMLAEFCCTVWRRSRRNETHRSVYTSTGDSRPPRLLRLGLSGVWSFSHVELLAHDKPLPIRANRDRKNWGVAVEFASIDLQSKPDCYGAWESSALDHKLDRFDQPRDMLPAKTACGVPARPRSRGLLRRLDASLQASLKSIGNRQTGNPAPDGIAGRAVGFDTGASTDSWFDNETGQALANQTEKALEASQSTYCQSFVFFSRSVTTTSSLQSQRGFVTKRQAIVQRISTCQLARRKFETLFEARRAFPGYSGESRPSVDRTPHFDRV